MINIDICRLHHSCHQYIRIKTYNIWLLLGKALTSPQPTGGRGVGYPAHGGKRAGWEEPRRAVPIRIDVLYDAFLYVGVDT